MKKLLTALAVFGVALGGCTWVDLDAKGKQVQIGYAGDIQQCERLGVVSASTQTKIVMNRDESKVQEELYTLARNNAAAMGATNLVQHGMPKDGEQSFTAYRCNPAYS